jgi:ubiquinone biosynthesis protein COQ9
MVCTAVARCRPNILDVMVLENVNLSSDKIWRTPLWSNETDSDFYHQTLTYAVSAVYIQPNVNFRMYIGLRSV